MDRRAWSLMWLLALVWGASYLLIKLGLEDMDPAFLVFARLLLAAAVLIPLARAQGALRGLRPVAGPLVVLAAVQVAAPFLLITFGEQHIASSLTGILVASAPIFTALLGYLGFGPRVGGWNLAGVLIGIVGVGMLFGVDLTGDSAALAGGLMVVLASLGYAIGAIYLRKHLAGRQPIGIAAASMTISALLVLPAAIAQAPDAVPHVKAIAAVVALGVFGTGVAFWIFYTLIAELGAAKASIVAYLAPAFALFYGRLFLDEPVTLGGAGGLVLILAGSYVAAEGRAPWQRRPLAVPAPASG